MFLSKNAARDGTHQRKAGFRAEWENIIPLIDVVDSRRALKRASVYFLICFLAELAEQRALELNQPRL